MITPQIIQSDRGSENTVIGALLEEILRIVFLVKSFRYGTSTANQRINMVEHF